MRRNLNRTITTSLAVLATTGAIVGGASAPAGAATYDRGYSNSDRHTTDGTGDADAHSNATDAGRLKVYTQARGGNPGATSLPGAQETKGSARATWGKRVFVADGTYRIVFHWKGVQGDERDRGQTSDARAVRQSTVKFVSRTGGGNRSVKRVQELPDNESNRSTRVVVSVPNNESGYLRLGAVLRAASTATGGNSSARATGQVDNISVSVHRI